MLLQKPKDDSFLSPPVVGHKDRPVLGAPLDVRLVEARLWGCVISADSDDFQAEKRERLSDLLGKTLVYQ
jgi:hypothetical protein